MSTPVAGQSPLQQLLNFIQSEPALLTGLLATAATMIAAYGSDVSQAQEAAIVTIATAAMAIFTAFMARPVSVPIISGAVITGLTAAAAWGLKLSPDVLSLVTSALGIALTALVWRLHLTPSVSLRAAARRVPVG